MAKIRGENCHYDNFCFHVSCLRLPDGGELASCISHQPELVTSASGIVSLPANTGGFHFPKEVSTPSQLAFSKKTLVLLPALSAKRGGQKVTVFRHKGCCVFTADAFFLLPYAARHTT
ncbi:MAG: hypothetical protein ACE5FF_09575 [Saprospiraceae bacterium]